MYQRHTCGSINQYTCGSINQDDLFVPAPRHRRNSSPMRVLCSYRTRRHQPRRSQMAGSVVAWDANPCSRHGASDIFDVALSSSSPQRSQQSGGRQDVGREEGHVAERYGMVSFPLPVSRCRGYLFDANVNLHQRTTSVLREHNVLDFPTLPLLQIPFCSQEACH